MSICTLLLLLTSSVVSLKRAEALSLYFTGISNKTLTVALFEQAIKQAPMLVPRDIYLRLVHTGLISGKTYPELLGNALRREPDDPQILMLLGVTELFESDSYSVPQSEALIQEALEKTARPDQMRYDIAVAFQNLAVYFNRQNHLEKATQLYLKALQYYPNYPLVLYSLGRIYVDQQQIPQAVETFMTLGQVYEHLNHSEDASLAYQTVLQLAPDHPVALRKLQNTKK